MNTLEESLKCLITRRKTWAKQSWELYETMVTPMVNDLKAIIQMNLIKNNKVTTYDVILA